jgi:hypothetical protein
LILEHHDLDISPIPKETAPLFINEPWLIDDSQYELFRCNKDPECSDDNVRVYIPLDINKKAILRRLDRIIARYGEANEKNEAAFSADVCRLISQIEIYDQVWCVRHLPSAGTHSIDAVELVKEFISKLERIPDGCAETFPFELVEELKGEFLRN